MAALAASNRTNIVRVSLSVVVHVAIVEIDVPRVRSVVGVCSTGPIVVGLRSNNNVHSLKRPSGDQRNPILCQKGTNFCFLMPYRRNERQVTISTLLNHTKG